MIRGYTLAGNRIAFVGWANRLLVVLYCLWVVTVAIQALKLNRKRDSGTNQAEPFAAAARPRD
jgi:hypothetical protein